jgi:hypothetical protein
MVLIGDRHNDRVGKTHRGLELPKQRDSCMQLYQLGRDNEVLTVGMEEALRCFNGEIMPELLAKDVDRFGQCLRRHNNRPIDRVKFPGFVSSRSTSDTRALASAIIALLFVSIKVFVKVGRQVCRTVRPVLLSKLGKL